MKDFGGIHLTGVSDIESFAKDDTIKLLFDFENDEWSIYHNDNYLDKQSLNETKSILPGISIHRSGVSIQIGNCNFYN